MKKKITLGGALTLALMLATATFIMTMIYAQKSFDSRVFNIKERENMYAKLSEVDQLVRREYFKDIDETNLNDGIVSGYIYGLNDYNAEYLTPEEYKEYLNKTEGRIVGIGASFERDPSGYIVITSIIDNSPAQLMELNVGDIITKVEDIDVTNENYNLAIDTIYGEAGTTLSLNIRTANSDKSVIITRRKIDTPSIESKKISIEQDIGYIRFLEFNSTTYTQFNNIITTWIGENINGLVLDLRNCGDENVENMLNVLNRIVSNEELLYTVDKEGNRSVLKNGNSISLNLPISVLVNSKTYLSAELFAASLRDFADAKIVGSVTSGVCSNKKTSLLSDGSAIIITTSLYECPISGSFEGIGIKPDYEIRLSNELEENIFNLDELSDLQLKKAIEAVGRTPGYVETFENIDSSLQNNIIN